MKASNNLLNVAYYFATLGVLLRGANPQEKDYCQASNKANQIASASFSNPRCEKNTIGLNLNRRGKHARKIQQTIQVKQDYTKTFTNIQKKLSKRKKLSLILISRCPN